MNINADEPNDRPLDADHPPVDETGTGSPSGDPPGPDEGLVSEVDFNAPPVEEPGPLVIDLCDLEKSLPKNKKARLSRIEEYLQFNLTIWLTSAYYVHVVERDKLYRLGGYKSVEEWAKAKFGRVGETIRRWRRTGELIDLLGEDAKQMNQEQILSLIPLKKGFSSSEKAKSAITEVLEKSRNDEKDGFVTEKIVEEVGNFLDRPIKKSSPKMETLVKGFIKKLSESLSREEDEALQKKGSKILSLLEELFPQEN